MYLQLYIKKTDTWLKHEQQTNEHTCKYTEIWNSWHMSIKTLPLLTQYGLVLRKLQNQHTHTHTNLVNHIFWVGGHKIQEIAATWATGNRNTDHPCLQLNYGQTLIHIFTKHLNSIKPSHKVTRWSDSHSIWSFHTVKLDSHLQPFNLQPSTITIYTWTFWTQLSTPRCKYEQNFGIHKKKLPKLPPV